MLRVGHLGQDQMASPTDTGTGLGRDTPLCLQLAKKSAAGAGEGLRFRLQCLGSGCRVDFVTVTIKQQNFSWMVGCVYTER